MNRSSVSPQVRGSVSSRRALLALPPILLGSQYVRQASAAIGGPAPGGVKAEESDYIQNLVARSRAKEAERYKERLDQYNRKNFCDYFAYEVRDGQNGKGAAKVGLSRESIAEMEAFLKKNCQ